MDNSKFEYDVVVIGGGPGGYVAAIRSAQLGLKVALIEKEHLGGICLNWGCIPTKALLRCSEVNHLLHNLSDYGFSAENIKFDFTKVIERSRKVADKLSGGIAHLLKKNKVTIIDGYARIVNSNKVEIESKDKKKSNVTTKNIIIATGARARILPNLEPDNKFIWTYKEAMVASSLPKSLLVIGSGAIGVEFASFYKNMGSDVTIIEISANILAQEDKEISDLAHKSFVKQGIKILTNSSVKNITRNKNNVSVDIENNGKLEKYDFDKIIVAAGVVANVENIGLENTKIKLEKGSIVTNEYLQTNESNIYAIGDVTTPPWLAHKASHEGIIAAEKIAGKNPHKMKKTNIPACTYAMPQIASIGLTEAKAKEQGYDVNIGRFPYVGNGKAIAMGETEGLIKTIFDKKTGELLGAHLIGAEVTEMIGSFVMGKEMEATELDFIHAIFPHPTLSEMLHESVLDAYGRVIHF